MSHTHAGGPNHCSPSVLLLFFSPLTRFPFQHGGGVKSVHEELFRNPWMLECRLSMIFSHERVKWPELILVIYFTFKFQSFCNRVENIWLVNYSLRRPNSFELWSKRHVCGLYRSDIKIIEHYTNQYLTSIFMCVRTWCQNQPEQRRMNHSLWWWWLTFVLQLIKHFLPEDTECS